MSNKIICELLEINFLSLNYLNSTLFDNLNDPTNILTILNTKNIPQINKLPLKLKKFNIKYEDIEVENKLINHFINLIIYRKCFNWFEINNFDINNYNFIHGNSKSESESEPVIYKKQIKSIVKKT